MRVEEKKQISEVAAEIQSNASYCEKYRRMKKLPNVKEGRNTDHKYIEGWRHVAKEKNHIYFNN